MLVLFVATFVGILYLAGRIGKFDLFGRIAKERRIRQVLCLAVVVAGTAVLWMAWGSMNAVVCVLHLIVFWLICDGIFALIGKNLLTDIMRGSLRLSLLWHIWEWAGIRRIMCGRLIIRCRQIKR